MPLLSDLSIKAKRLAAREPTPQTARELGVTVASCHTRAASAVAKAPLMLPCKRSGCSPCWETSEIKGI